MSDDNKKIYGYARVSSAKQTDNNSFEAQAEKINQKARYLKGDLNYQANIFQETISGSIEPKNRPIFFEMYAQLKRGDIFIVAKMDRLGRDLRMTQNLVKDLNDKGVKLFILDLPLMDSDICDESTSMLIFQIFGAFAEWERKRIVERMAEGKRIAEERAKMNGEPFGKYKRITQAQLDEAMKLLKTHTYMEVVERTGISKSSLIREVRRIRAMDIKLRTEELDDKEAALDD